MKLKSLAILTSVLFIISIIVFFNENKRGSDLSFGSDYIKGLDIEKIKKIIITPKKSELISFAKEGSRFLLESHKSYPVSPVKINDLIYKMAGIQVREKIATGASEDTAKKFELDKKSRRYLVEIVGNDGHKVVSFSVGRDRKGRGSYLYNEKNKDIYLSMNRFSINSSHKDYIDKKFLDLKKESIKEVAIKGKSKLTLAKKGEKFVIVSPKGKKIKEEKISEYINHLRLIKFEDYYEYNSNKVRLLKFDKGVDIRLNNELIYKLKFAKKNKDYFIQASAHASNIPSKIIVNRDDGEEKLKNIDDLMSAQKEYQRFNSERAGWIYKINQSTYDQLVKSF